MGNPETLVRIDENKDVTYAEMEKKVDAYIHFNGIGFSTEQRQEILNCLDVFRDNKENFETEMICEIRTMNGD